MIAFKNNSTILFYAGILSILASINSCTHTTEKQINKSIAAEKGFFEVNAVGQTQPVESSDDAADDPAIWVNSADVSKSTIIGTDK
nr:phytase [Bacteroidota bacterium]